MEVDFSSFIRDTDGEIYKGKEKGVEVDLSLGKVIAVLLKTNMPGDERLGSEEREKLFDLLLKANNSEDRVDLTAKEIDLLKDRISRSGFDNVVVGQSLKRLGGKETGIQE